jgi:hypothetical protein
VDVMNCGYIFRPFISNDLHIQSPLANPLSVSYVVGDALLLYHPARLNLKWR